MKKKEEMSEEIENEKVKKDNKILLLVIVILTVIIVGLLGYIIGTGTTNKQKDNNELKEQINDTKEEEKTESTENEEVKINLEITDEIKKKLERFINIGSHIDYTGLNTTLSHFMNGTNTLPEKIKLKMTKNAVYEDKLYVANTSVPEDVVPRLEGLKPAKNEIVDIIKVDDFNKIYKELFNKEPNYKIEDLSNIGCPAPLSIDNESREMYLYHRCGGTGTKEYSNYITSYDSDTNYYYIHEEIVEKDIATKESKTTKLIWKFDKNLTFISTEKE